MLQLFFFQLLNGAGLGFIYFLLAIGLSVIFGLLGFVNFAHGAFFALAAYLTFALTSWGISFWWCLLAVPLLTAAAGALVEKGILRSTYGPDHSRQLIVTFGLALVIQEAIAWVFGTRALNVSIPPALSGQAAVGDFYYPNYRLFVVGVGIVLALGLWLLLSLTRVGAIVRAASESQETLQMLGVNVNAVYSGAFAVGISIAGIAGTLAAPLRGVDPLMGIEALGIGFVVVVLGGLGSFAGTFVAALLVGITQSLTGMVWSEASNLAVYIAMAAIILFRPYGILGKH
jgi:branched-chain amino acid transport system permease protein